MTSHRHPPIHPSVAAQREDLHRLADTFEKRALECEMIANALGCCTAPAPKEKAQYHASLARDYRRMIRSFLGRAADLTDWRDDLDRKAGNWIEPLVALYKATCPAPQPTPYAQAA